MFFSSFDLTAGFATANSDLDVIFTGGSQAIFPDKSQDEALDESPDELEDDPISPDFRIQLLLESKLQKEGFDAQLLTKTRVPILKLVQNATEESPFELHCDIGFSNHLAVFNTQMLLTYSKCDPRVKQMMIFIKVHTSRSQNLPLMNTVEGTSLISWEVGGFLDRNTL